MTRIALILILTMLVGLAAVAQDKAAQTEPRGKAAADNKNDGPLPTIDQILDKFVSAVGGKEAIEKHKSRVIKGAFDIEAMGMSGTVEIYTVAPNKNRVIVDLPGVGQFNQVFDGEKAWSANPMEGLRELDGEELAATKRRSDFYGELNMRKYFPKMEIKGRDKVGSADVIVVEATPEVGGPEKFYFDQATGLLIRHDFEANSPQGKVPTETYMEDYKVIDGIKVAHTMRQVNPMFSMTMKFSEIKNNVEVEATKFNKPSTP